MTSKQIINTLTKNKVTEKIHITEHNIENVFEWFEENVWKDKNTSSHDIVGYFIETIYDPDNKFFHPLTPEEKKRITSIADRLIEDSSRRRTGDFWTPQIWVDESHRRISNLLGDDWKEKYVVWDPACGTKNLTRDYRFSELYCSTLFQSELDMSKDYNREGEAFQFDFLNDPLEKAPKGLLEALENDKPFVFFLNPPYSVAGGGLYKESGKVKKGDNSNMVSKMMKDGKVGKPAVDTSYQFIYRICMIREKYHLSNCHIFIYSGVGFLRSTSADMFRFEIHNNFGFDGGYIINASEFANVSASWAIGFTMWGKKNEDSYNEYHVDVMRRTIDGCEKVCDKILYNVPSGQRLVDWCSNGKNKDLPAKDIIPLAKGLYPKGDIISIPDNVIGFHLYDKNRIAHTDGLKLFFSAPYASGFNKFYINEDNFEKVNCIHAVRWLPEGDWINKDDEFMIPNESHPKFRQFMLDSLIFSLFDTANYCTSTDHDYAGRHWDINNEFFWMSRDEMKALANEHHNNDVYSDADTDSERSHSALPERSHSALLERYVYKYIQEHKDKFSPDALAVLNTACELVKKSFKLRDLYNQEHPEIQVNHWDAGWYQIKQMLKAFMPDDLKEFRKNFKTFESRLRPLVYELGFLRK